MSENAKIGGMWLTVNRRCNFRCIWCYAEGTGYSKSDDMSPVLADQLVEFASQLGVMNVILIGGEPTWWPQLLPIIFQIDKLGMTSTLVTNGYRFSSVSFVDRYKDSPLASISLSIKGGNRKQHLELTKTDSFQRVCQGMRNLAVRGIKFNVSITVSEHVLNNLEELVTVASGHGATGVSLQFCSATFNNTVPVKGSMVRPGLLVSTIVKKYDAMHAATHGKLSLEQTLPACIWPNGFLEMLHERNQLVTGCHVQRREGIIFDPQGNLIPCNCLTAIPLGRFGVDFQNVSSFETFWNDSAVTEFYDRIIAYPVIRCMGCSTYHQCGGGCPLQWFVFEPRDIIPQEDSREKESTRVFGSTAR